MLESTCSSRDVCWVRQKPWTGDDRLNAPGSPCPRKSKLLDSNPAVCKEEFGKCGHASGSGFR